MDCIPLNMLGSGAWGQVVAIMGGPDQVQRIKELGFQNGAELQMVQAGSPCIVRMGGQTLCFRGGELLSILVQPRPAA